MHYALAFAAGFVSTLTVHQGLLALFHALGATPDRPYSMKRTAPLGVPEVLSLAFWGGLWGVALWVGLQAVGGGWAYWLVAIVLGAIGPTLAVFAIVFPLKGRPAAPGGLGSLIAGALVLNGAWGLGVAAMLYVTDQLFGTR